MANRYNQGFNYTGATHFDSAPLSQVEHSSMTVDPTWYVPLNAGDIVPCFYEEVLPHSTFQFDLNFVLRQISASLRPTMGKMQVDIFAFFVPNRVVNDSWRNVTGENTSGFWTAPEVELAPLMHTPNGVTQIPVDSIADLYGLPSQSPIPNAVLSQMNDLKFRGYLSIYNNYFRDENYQPLKSFSKLNVYEGFLLNSGTNVGILGLDGSSIQAGQDSDGSYAKGAVVKALLGEGTENRATISGLSRLTNYSFKDKPLKANKLHDAFTSVLPSPQKGPEVVFSTAGTAPVNFTFGNNTYAVPGSPLEFRFYNTAASGQNMVDLKALVTPGQRYGEVYASADTSTPGSTDPGSVNGWNVEATADLSKAVGVSINELRTSIATQQVLELLARGGSRYWSFLKSFFGIEADNPFPDIPTQIGHLRRDMDLYQVAQTAPGENSPQGSLTAFGYTTKGGAMFTKTFIEHGYIHCFAVIRQRNVYSTLCMPDNFRRKTMDFYLPQFANIGEQPIRLATLNPFKQDSMELALGYQEAWWEYRYSPDRLLGSMRSGVPQSLDVWHFGDYFDPDFTHVNGEWLISDAQEVLDRTLAVTSALSPQFLGQFEWRIKKQLPMPIYSVPGLDTI